MLKQLSPRCWMLPNDHAADRPSLGCICGDRYTLLVDGGNSPVHAALMLREMAEHGLPAPSFVAVTHAHWDHTYGLCGVDVPVIACRATQERLTAMSRWQWTPEAMAARVASGEELAFCNEMIPKEYADPQTIRVRTADLVFDTNLTLDLGGCTVRLMQQTNSHENDCVMLLALEEQVIFLGDITYEDLHRDPPCIHRSRFEALRLALSALDFRFAVPGHQDVMTRQALFADMEETLRDPEIALLP